MFDNNEKLLNGGYANLDLSFQHRNQFFITIKSTYLENNT